MAKKVRKRISAQEEAKRALLKAKERKKRGLKSYTRKAKADEDAITASGESKLGRATRGRQFKGDAYSTGAGGIKRKSKAKTRKKKR